MNITRYSVTNYDYATSRSYEDLVAAFEQAVADAENGQVAKALAEAQNAGQWESALGRLFGPSGFVRTFSMDHGRWLSFYGAPAKAKKYVYGNPVVAETMLRHDVRAGLQLPLSLLIYENKQGKGCISFDLPSTLTSFTHQLDLTSAAQALDAKLLAFVEQLVGAAPEPAPPGTPGQ
ncbi:DUF302 domain-containing protein [Streptomyces sp. NPDC048409]|uniref:DUF302 domain-containing protein n=1 Tax=Streptomyces sp. NPDC048409 TaxID=3154723 RepID=UPI003418961E